MDERQGYEDIARIQEIDERLLPQDINPFERTQFMKYYSNHEE